jgi:hypothetical protein
MINMPKHAKIYLVLAIIFAATSGVNAKAIDMAVSGDFEGNGKLNKFEYAVDRSGMEIDYYSTTGKKIHYEQKAFDECSSMALYQVVNTPQIAIDGSCSSQGGQIFTHIYEWSRENADWCLIREITGEKADLDSNDAAGSRQVNRVLGCPRIGNDGPYSYPPQKAISDEIRRKFAFLNQIKNNKKLLTAYFASVPFYDSIEISENVTVDNVAAANDFAYHLLESGRSDDSIQLLETLVRGFPDRVVAKLNLADAYWDSQLNQRAQGMYTLYVAQMKQLGKSARIPSQVYARLKPNH